MYSGKILLGGIYYVKTRYVNKFLKNIKIKKNGQIVEKENEGEEEYYYEFNKTVLYRFLKDYVEDGSVVYIEGFNDPMRKERIIFYKNDFYTTKQLLENTDGVLDCVLGVDHSYYNDQPSSVKKQLREMYIKGINDMIECHNRGGSIFG